MSHREGDIIAELEAMNRFDAALFRLADALLVTADQARRTRESLERFLQISAREQDENARAWQQLPER